MLDVNLTIEEVDIFYEFMDLSLSDYLRDFTAGLPCETTKVSGLSQPYLSFIFFCESSQVSRNVLSEHCHLKYSVQKIRQE
jgi:hypothetical protein